MQRWRWTTGPPFTGLNMKLVTYIYILLSNRNIFCVRSNKFFNLSINWFEINAYHLNELFCLNHTYMRFSSIEYKLTTIIILILVIFNCLNKCGNLGFQSDVMCTSKSRNRQSLWFWLWQKKYFTKIWIG